MISGAQNAKHEKNPVFRSTLTESKVLISDIPHLPGSPVQCVCIDVANCVGFSLDAQLYSVLKNCLVMLIHYRLKDCKQAKVGYLKCKKEHECLIKHSMESIV